MMSGPVVACWRMFFPTPYTRGGEGDRGPPLRPLGYPKIFIRGNSIIFAKVRKGGGGNQNFFWESELPPFKNVLFSILRHRDGAK